MYHHSIDLSRSSFKFFSACSYNYRQLAAKIECMTSPSHTQSCFIISLLSFRVNNHISLVKYIDKWSKCAFQSTPNITRRRRAMTIFFHFPLLYVCLSLNSRHRRLISGPSPLTYSALFFLLLPSFKFTFHISTEQQQSRKEVTNSLAWP